VITGEVPFAGSLNVCVATDAPASVMSFNVTTSPALVVFAKR
jgi:hypothetical protein